MSVEQRIKGATLTGFCFHNYFEAELQCLSGVEVRIILCSDWRVGTPEEWNSCIENRQPFAGAWREAARGMYLAGFVGRTVSSFKEKSRSMVLGFGSGPNIVVPIVNTVDEGEDSIVIQTASWVPEEGSWGFVVTGDGHLS